MSVNSARLATNTFHILFYDVLRTIPIFKSGFENLTIKRKFMILITNIRTNLSWINIDPHKYDSDSEALLPATFNAAISSSPNILPLSGHACIPYIDVAAKIKVTSKKTTKEEEKQIFQRQAKEMMELFWDTKFTPWRLKLDH